MIRSQTGNDDVDADPQGRQFPGHDAGEGVTPSLGGAVGVFSECEPIQSGGGANDHDRAATGRRHGLNHILAGQVHPGEICADDLLPNRQLEAVDPRVTGEAHRDAGRRHGGVEPAPSRGDRRNRGGDLLLISNVGRQLEHVSA